MGRAAPCTARAVARTLIVCLLHGLAAPLLWWIATPPMSELNGAVTGRLPLEDWTFDRLVGGLACGAMLVAYLASACSVVVVLAGRFAAALPQRGPCRLRRLEARVPRGWRRMVLVACGLSVITPAMASATYASGPATEPGCPTGCVSGLGGLPLPDLPTARSALPSLVVVAPGDSLWRIGASRLPPGASDIQISAYVDLLCRRNRTRIGTNPDLIFPGMHLIAPKGTP
ncbi:MAG: hypothetical protein ACRDPG_03730 [Nocardioidaceae bacterium]